MYDIVNSEHTHAIRNFSLKEVVCSTLRKRKSCTVMTDRAIVSNEKIIASISVKMTGAD